VKMQKKKKKIIIIIIKWVYIEVWQTALMDVCQFLNLMCYICVQKKSHVSLSTSLCLSPLLPASLRCCYNVTILAWQGIWEGSQNTALWMICGTANFLPSTPNCLGWSF
jgi:hypothetical protein